MVRRQLAILAQVGRGCSASGETWGKQGDVLPGRLDDAPHRRGQHARLVEQAELVRGVGPAGGDGAGVQR